MWTTVDKQDFQASSSGTIAPGSAWAGGALDQQRFNLFHTCDWSWPWIPRPPSCRSTRNHQDRTGVAAAAAAWILMKTLSVQSMQAAADWQANAVMFQVPSSGTTAPGSAWAGGALDQQRFNLFHTCDWSWSRIPRPPSCRSTRNHQDLTRIGAAAAAWILMKTLSVQSMQAAADWQANAVMFQVPSSGTTAPGSAWAGGALDQQRFNLFHTCDWSWSRIPRPPSCRSTRNHQDLTRIGAAAAAWILMKTLSGQSMQAAADWQANAAMFQAASSAITAPGIIWAGVALQYQLYNYFNTCDLFFVLHFKAAKLNI